MNYKPITCELCPPSYGHCEHCGRCERHCDCLDAVARAEHWAYVEAASRVEHEVAMESLGPRTKMRHGTKL